MTVKRAESNPWIRRCPQGHTTLDIHRETYRCHSCGGIYHGNPYDVREHEFPVEDAPEVIRPSREAVLQALVECTRPTRSHIRTEEVSRRPCVEGTTKQVSRTLRMLFEDGLVERAEGSTKRHRVWWWPTEAGIERIRGGDD